MTFKNSAYEYKSYVYNTVYAMIIINWLVATVNVLLRGIGYTTYVVIYTGDNGIAVCSSNDSLGKPALIFSITMNILIQIILLYMFSRGLWKLNRKMLEHYMADQMNRNRSKSQDQDQNTGTPSAPSSPTTPSSLTRATSLSIVVDKYKSDGGKSEETITRIIQLYNLIKKQAILVCISVLSTTMLGGMALFDDLFVFEMGWDGALNVICVWMMLSTSKRYWDCCKDNGLCKCCYLKTGNAQ